MGPAQRARQARTELFLRNPDRFYQQLFNEIEAFIKSAERKGMKPSLRPNVLSDRRDLGKRITEQFPNLHVYDYTKNARPWNAPYPLTFSWSESPRHRVETLAKYNINTAVVFSTKKTLQLPSEWKGIKVIDGDTHDLRFLDQTPRIVGLRWKGSKQRLNEALETGFVQEAP